MMGLFIIIFFLFLGYVGLSGVSLIATGTAGMIFVFAVVCVESFALIKWFMGEQEFLD